MPRERGTRRRQAGALASYGRPLGGGPRPVVAVAGPKPSSGRRTRSLTIWFLLPGGGSAPDAVTPVPSARAEDGGGEAAGVGAACGAFPSGSQAPASGIRARARAREGGYVPLKTSLGREGPCGAARIETSGPPVALALIVGGVSVPR